VKAYLAARYSRRAELCGYRDALEEIGYEVTSRWLDGGHDVMLGAEDFSETCAQYAQEDLDDIDCAEVLILFTDPPGSEAPRGGKHVETGYALGTMKPVWVVGPRTNLFYHLPNIHCYETWDDLISRL